MEKNILVTAVAKIMGKDQQSVRQAMIEGLLPIRVAFRKKGSSRGWQVLIIIINLNFTDKSGCGSTGFVLVFCIAFLHN